MNAGDTLLTASTVFSLDETRNVRLEHALFIGAHAEVWLARLSAPDAPDAVVVVRMLRRNRGDGMPWEERARRFRNGYDIALANPDLFPVMYGWIPTARTTDSGVATWRHPAMVMEYVTGGTLRAALRVAGDNPRALLELLRSLFSQLVRLHAAGVWHGDLSGVNVLLRPEPNGGYRVLFIDLDGAHDEAQPGSDLNLGGQPRFWIPEGLRERNTPEKREAFDVTCVYTELKVALRGGTGEPSALDDTLPPVIGRLVRAGQTQELTAERALAAVEEALTSLSADPLYAEGPSAWAPEAASTTDIPAPQAAPVDPYRSEGPAQHRHSATPVEPTHTDIPSATHTDIPSATATQRRAGVPVRPTPGYVLPSRTPRQRPARSAPAGWMYGAAVAVVALSGLLGHAWADTQAADALELLHGTDPSGDLRLRHAADAGARAVLDRAMLPLRIARWADPLGTRTRLARAEFEGLSCRLHLDRALCADANPRLAALLDGEPEIAAMAGRALYELDVHAQMCPSEPEAKATPETLRLATESWTAWADLGEPAIDAWVARADVSRRSGRPADALTELSTAAALADDLPDRARAAARAQALIAQVAAEVTPCQPPEVQADRASLLAGACGAIALGDQRGARLRLRTALSAPERGSRCHAAPGWRERVSTGLAALDNGRMPADLCPTIVEASP